MLTPKEFGSFHLICKLHYSNGTYWTRPFIKVQFEPFLSVIVLKGRSCLPKAPLQVIDLIWFGLIWFDLILICFVGRWSHDYLYMSKVWFCSWTVGFISDFFFLCFSTSTSNTVEKCESLQLDKDYNLNDFMNGCVWVHVLLTWPVKDVVGSWKVQHSYILF